MWREEGAFSFLGGPGRYPIVSGVAGLQNAGAFAANRTAATDFIDFGICFVIFEDAKLIGTPSLLEDANLIGSFCF